MTPKCRLYLYSISLAARLLWPTQTVWAADSGPSVHNKNTFKEYRNKEYGFELHYAKEMRLSSNFVSHYHGPSSAWGTPIIAVVYRPNGDQSYPNVEVRISINSGSTRSEACGDVATDPAIKQQTETINGQKYTISFIEGAGMSQYVNGLSYTTFYKGTCFQADRFVTDSGAMGTEEEKRVTQSYYEQTDKIVKSFRLLK